jgi:Pyruvate/2-oxoacid:ferredoxin oxidoreductase delta subunit
MDTDGVIERAGLETELKILRVRIHNPPGPIAKVGKCSLCALYCTDNDPLNYFALSQSC